ncbi:MAG: GAF domain-containing protein [Bacteroidota bacterium]
MTPDKKSARYERLFEQLSELLKKCSDTHAQMATISAVLFHKMPTYFWCGFYRVEPENLVVITYQGPVACQLLLKNKGVCWAAVNQNKTIVVENVETFPDHIVCDSRSKSEIVVPIKNKMGVVKAVLDIDSEKLNSFDEIDVKYLEKIVQLIYLKD